MYGEFLFFTLNPYHCKNKTCPSDYKCKLNYIPEKCNHILHKIVKDCLI